jgi:hypothetical protein
MNNPPIYFYIPSESSSNIYWPETIEEYWEWLKSQAIPFPGEQSWVLQTYLYLKDAKFPCYFTNTLPDEGIVIAHRASLKKKGCIPNSRVLFVCARADKNPYPYAQLHVVQNMKQVSEKGISVLWESYYIPHWPQTGLIPRAVERGDYFENIVYLGDPVNLAPELTTDSWKKQVEALGLNWLVMGNAESWNDYTNVDAVLAVRSFSKENRYDHKPASKLYNAWKAGVPAILGLESAYQTERKCELDYLEVATMETLISSIVRLRDDIHFRRMMILNGKKRSQEVEPSAIRNKWIDFLVNRAVPTYFNWRNSSELSQRIYLSSRQISYCFWRTGKLLRDSMKS